MTNLVPLKINLFKNVYPYTVAEHNKIFYCPKAQNDNYLNKTNRHLILDITRVILMFFLFSNSENYIWLDFMVFWLSS